MVKFPQHGKRSGNFRFFRRRAGTSLLIPPASLGQYRSFVNCNGCTSRSTAAASFMDRNRRAQFPSWRPIFCLPRHEQAARVQIRNGNRKSRRAPVPFPDHAAAPLSFRCHPHVIHSSVSWRQLYALPARSRSSDVSTVATTFAQTIASRHRRYAVLQGNRIRSADRVGNTTRAARNATGRLTRC